MEPNTARRSSNQQHALIKAIMRHQSSHEPVHLVREGIHYRQDGIDYIDTHYDFNRIVNAYLKCIRLYNNDNYTEGDRVWRRELGHVQREVMWLVQRYCEKNRSFWPLADNYKDTAFIRSFEIYNFNTNKQEHIFDTASGQFISDFGLDNSDSGVAIYKGAAWSAAAGRSVRGRWPCCARVADLVAVNRLSVDATQNAELRPEISVSISLGRAR